MKERVLTLEQLAAYDGHLRRRNGPRHTEKYLRDLRAFALWLDGRPLERSWPTHGSRTCRPRAMPPLPSTPSCPP